MKYSEIEDVINWYCDTGNAIKWAKEIVVVGGGSNGIQLCGEIKAAYKSKNVVFIHRGRAIVENFSPSCNTSFQKKLLKQALALGIEVIPGERVTNLDMNEFVDRPFVSGFRKIKLSSGNSFDADLVIAFGVKSLSSEIYRKSWLNEIGQITVEETLQVKGHPNVFGIGDINDVEENKQGYLAQMQGIIAAKNINRLISNSQSSKLTRYKKSKKTTLMVALGRKNGASNFGKMSAGASVTSRLKGKDLFTRATWELYNQSDALLPEDIVNWQDYVLDDLKLAKPIQQQIPIQQQEQHANSPMPTFRPRNQISSYGRNITDFDQIHLDANANDAQLIEEENQYLERERRKRKKKKKRPVEDRGRDRQNGGSFAEHTPQLRPRPDDKDRDKRQRRRKNPDLNRRKKRQEASRLSMLARELL